MILVTGATGNVGRLLIGQLASAGEQVRAVTRHPRTAGLPTAVEVVEGDPSRPATIAAPLHGVTGLFVNPRSVGTGIDDLLLLSRQQGVQRVAALSAINADDDPAEQPSRYNGDRNTEVEAAVTRCGIDWVSLRPSVFAINTIGMWAAQIRAGNVVRGPYAAFEEAPIDLRDLAEVAARALLTDELAGQRPVLTGPQSLSQQELVATIGDALGRRLRYQEAPPQAARQAMAGAGGSRAPTWPAACCGSSTSPRRSSRSSASPADRVPGKSAGDAGLRPRCCGAAPVAANSPARREACPG